MSAVEQSGTGPAWSAAPGEFHNPVTVHFGAGCWREAGRTSEAARLLLLTTPGMVRRGTARAVQAGWGGGGAFIVCDRVASHPELSALTELARELRGAPYDGLVALGGGSVIDTAKILSVLLADPSLDLAALLRADGAARIKRTLPVHALPTTAGTGSEVTPFATVWNRASGEKHSLNAPGLFPRTAWVDPTLTRGAPFAVAAASGLDALSQALESVWSLRANRTTIGHSLHGFGLALAALPRLKGSRDDPEILRDLAQASLSAGLAISHTRTALAHSMSYPLTARFGLPHGLACSFTLPAVLEFNAGADDGRLAHTAAVAGCGSIAGLRDRLVAALDAVDMDGLLRAHAIDGARLQAVASEMIHPGRADNNLRPAGLAEVRGILAATGRYLPACRESHA